MEAAAKKVQLLTQRILPDRPHHLSFSLETRYRVPADSDKLVEEWLQRGLQYMTFLSDADRGVLLTRPYFDMREEPPNPNETRNQKSEKKALTKLSLSDYKNKQRKPSPSPPDSVVMKKADPPRRDATEIRDQQEQRPSDRDRGKGSDASKTAAAQKARELPLDERSDAPEPKTKPNHNGRDTLEKRKRETITEEDSRPQKRNKPETGMSTGDRARTPREENPKKRDAYSSLDRMPTKDSKPSSSPALLNGRSMLKAAMGSQSTKSPASRSRESLVNGNRPSSSESSKNTPSRQDNSASKPMVPPLLSPLRLSIDDEDAQLRSERHRREDGNDHVRSQKPTKSDATAPQRKMRSPLTVPPLLSPTLPPAIEAELARINKKTSAKPSEAGQKGATLSDSPPNRSKNNRPPRKDEDGVETSRPQRFMVTLKYSRRSAKTVQRLLALPPKKDTSRAERSVSIEAPAPAQSRKRPVGSNETVGDTIAVKRPRTSDIATSSRLGAPSTPSNKTAPAMARIGSNNSQGNTPAETNSLTPGVLGPAERTASHEGKESAIPARVQALRDRGTRFSKLGSKLKHDRDHVLKLKHSEARGPPPVSETDMKLSVALGLESAMAYMLAFRAVFDSRRMENKAQDPKQWESILPFLSMLKHDVRVSHAMNAIYWQLQGIILEELIKCFWSLDPATHAQKIIGFERQRAVVWKTAFEAWERVESEPMRANLGPWTSVDDAVTAALRIMRRWSNEQNTGWRAEVTVSMANGAGR